jgi:hypothetical protein
VGRRAERRPQLASPRFRERTGPTATHHLDGTPISSTRHRIVSPPTQGTPRPPTRGQHRRGRYPHQANHTVTRYDDRAAPPVVSARLQRYIHSTPLHPFRGEYLGRYTQPQAGHRGLATHPATLRRPSSPMGPPLYRPLCIYAQR